ncbi:poly(ADP-ribose) glycohydrolase [Angomonas deanei]|nr:poly(ADP-ribose) glycohydrolase [Angomonas deanei]EPY35093.1 poly(ADP-ribose) glycohydrolase [Angomonas deanei]|eukprot:EPY34122.1 poly(ADP-ribose) glycohydrolase [Angomonas deanei]
MTAYELHHSHNDCHFEVSRVSYAQFPDFRNSRTPLGPFELLKSGFIENDVESLQVDFANKVIGGGVLGAGCVQEEVRFVISPQLLLSRLVCEVLLDNEAVLLSGAAQYSDYIGYASSFRFQDRRHPGTILSGVPTTTDLPRGNGKIQDICVVAVDAINFSGNVEDQYLASYILREVRKAFVGFHGPSAEKATCKLGNSGPIATGNWGCGAFGGDVELKVLIQWIAASEAKRPVRYYVFDRKDLLDSFPPVLAKLTNEKWSVGDLFLCLVLYFSNVSAGLNSATQTVSQYILATNIDELRELE